MAWNFNKGDIPDVTAIAAVHPDPALWWATVETFAVDTDVQALATQILAVLAAGGSTPLQAMEEAVQELRRIADTDATLEFTRVDALGDGSTIEVSAKAGGFIG